MTDVTFVLAVAACVASLIALIWVAGLAQQHAEDNAALRGKLADLRQSLGKTNGRVIDMRAWTAADLAEQRHRAQAPRRRGQDLPTQRDGSAS